MTLRITSIVEPGLLEKERIVMKFAEDDDVGHYALFASRIGTDGRPLSGNVEPVFWFADKAAKKGDLVVLYTKAGKVSEKENADGTSTHFFYWGRPEALWNSAKAPTLVKVPSWQTYKAPK